MDSLTQFVLGATVGEAVLGKKVGNKAIIWGGVAGTVPDLDVFFRPFFDEPGALLFHRSISHSLFFPILAAPLLGYLVSKLHNQGDYKDWTKLFFWSIFTHPLLDLFTGYGTGLLTPFFDQRFQLDTIFIIDPLYTLPLLIVTIWCLFLKRSNHRVKVNLIGLGLAQFYLVYTVYHKVVLDGIIRDNLLRQEIVSTKYMSAPAPLNNLLWWALVETDDEYKVGYYSFLDQSTDISFKSFPKSHDLLTSIEKDPGVELLKKFTKGFYSVDQSPNGLIFNDLRFGTVSGWFELSKDFIFSFELQQVDGNIRINRRPTSRKPSSEDFDKLIDRIKGI